MNTAQPLINKFAKFVGDKRRALGISQTDLAIEIYATEEYIKWRNYFAERDEKNLNEVDKKFYKKYREEYKRIANNRKFISEIELGKRQSLTFNTMDKILKVLNSEIEFVE